MSDVDRWLTDNKIAHAMAGPVSCYVFNPPPAMHDANGACIFSRSPNGREAARTMRELGWAVLLTSNPDEALRWLRGRGYGVNHDGSTTLRLPEGYRTFGSAKLDLVRLVEAIVKQPELTTRELADIMSKAHGRRIGRQIVNRAMIAVGWGPEQREAYRAGDAGRPTVVQDG